MVLSSALFRQLTAEPFSRGPADIFTGEEAMGGTSVCHLASIQEEDERPGMRDEGLDANEDEGEKREDKQHDEVDGNDGDDRGGGGDKGDRDGRDDRAEDDHEKGSDGNGR